MRQCGIYEIRNTINNKVYIGSSVDIRKRWWVHKSTLRYNNHNNTYLQNAWNKYGEDNFKFSIIIICEERDLLYYENALFKIMKSTDRDYGYNLALDALAPMKGKHHTEEAIEKIRQASLGRKHADTTKEKMRNIVLGRKASAETKEKLRQLKIGKKATTETKAKMSKAHKGTNNHFYGERHTPEARKKMSEAYKNKTKCKRDNKGRFVGLNATDPYNPLF